MTNHTVENGYLRTINKNNNIKNKHVQIEYIVIYEIYINMIHMLFVRTCDKKYGISVFNHYNK